MGKRILVVDDEPDLMEILKFRLESLGYEVITAGDGQTGLELARKENPDLIILDVMLPRLDGYKVCRMLKSDDKYKNTPIIMFTARVMESDVKTGQEVGADKYITKPFDPQKLVSAIEELLK